MRKARAKKSTQFERGSGNVFADLGFRAPETELAKAKLVLQIAETIRTSGLTQQKAASKIGVDQPKVSMLLRGHTQGFSTDRLLRILTQLGRDVEIQVKSSSAKRSVGHVTVSAPQRMYAHPRKARFSGNV